MFCLCNRGQLVQVNLTSLISRGAQQLMLVIGVFSVLVSVPTSYVGDAGSSPA